MNGFAPRVRRELGFLGGSVLPENALSDGKKTRSRSSKSASCSVITTKFSSSPTTEVLP